LAWPLPIEHLGVVYHITSRGSEKVEEAVEISRIMPQRKGMLRK